VFHNGIGESFYISQPIVLSILSSTQEKLEDERRMREQANQEQKELQNERDKLLSQLKSSSEQVRHFCTYKLDLQFLAGN